MIDRRRWYVIAAGITSGVLSAVVLSHGININPDGWAFWEGAVSIQQGYGYSHFHARLTVLHWPPLYSIYLLLWQSVLGISGKTLILANIALSILASASWTALFGGMIPSRLSRGMRRVLQAALVVFFVSFFAYHIKSVLSENLRFAVLSLYVIAVLRYHIHSRRGELYSAAMLLLWSAVLLLTHHSTLAFICAGCLLILRRLRGSAWPNALLVFVAGVALPVILWMLVRWSFAQLGSHPLYAEINADFFVENLLDTLKSLAILVLGPVPYTTAVFLVYVGALTILVLLGSSKSIQKPEEVSATPARFAGLSILILLLICQAAHIPILTRFIWFLPLLLLPWLLLRFFLQPALPRYAGIALIILPALVKVSLLIHATMFDSREYMTSKSEDRFITPEMYIDAANPDAIPRRTESGVLVSPPVFEWIRHRAQEPR